MSTRGSFSVVILCAVWGVAVSSAIVARPLLPVDETRYLAVAWEMWQRGDFLVPYLNGEPYSHKPPFLFWIMQAGWAVFGVNDWWPRLVAPLFGLAALLLTRRLGRLLWPGLPAAGDVAALVTLGALYWTLFTTMTMFDMLHGCFAVAGMIGLVMAARGRLVGGFAVFGLAVGFGVLGKGPAILVHLLPAALAAPLWVRCLEGQSDGDTPGWGRWYAGLGAGVALGAVIGLAWALPAASSGGDAYRNAILWGQSAGRMVDSFAHGRPFWWFAAILPVMVLPWLIWPAAWRTARGAAAEMAKDGGARLAFIWFTLAFVAFSAISGKQPHYLVPEFPALALLLSRALVAAPQIDGHGFWRRVDHWIPAALVLALAAVLAAAFHFDLKPSWATSAGDARLWPLAGVVAITAAYWCRPGTTVVSRVWRISALSVVLIVAVHLTLRPLMAESHDFRAFSKELKVFEDQGFTFVTFGKYHGQFQFLGRLTRPFGIVDGPAELEAWLKDHPKAMIVALHRELPEGAAPSAQVRFRSRLIGAWPADRYPPRVKRLGGAD